MRNPLLTVHQHGGDEFVSLLLEVKFVAFSVQRRPNNNYYEGKLAAQRCTQRPQPGVRVENLHRAKGTFLRNLDR